MLTTFNQKDTWVHYFVFQITKEKEFIETSTSVDAEPTLSLNSTQVESSIEDDLTLGKVDTSERLEINNVEAVLDDHETIANYGQDKVVVTSIDTEVLNNSQQPSGDEEKIDIALGTDRTDKNSLYWPGRIVFIITTSISIIYVL